MPEKQSLAITGNVTIEHWRGGKLLHRQRVHNIVVAQGLDYLCDRVFGVDANKALYIGLSTSDSAPAADAVNLNATEWVAGGLMRVLGVLELFNEGMAVIDTTFTASGAGIKHVGSAGLYMGAYPGDTLFAGAALDTPRNLMNNDQLKIVWEITFANG